VILVLELAGSLLSARSFDMCRTVVALKVTQEMLSSCATVYRHHHQSSWSRSIHAIHHHVEPIQNALNKMTRQFASV